MGDVCTAPPTFTSFSTGTQQGVSVLQSASQSLSVGAGNTVTMSIQSGSTWIFAESVAAGGTATVDIQIPVTVTVQQVIQVPVLTLFAPCSSSAIASSTISSMTSATPTTTTAPGQTAVTSVTQTSKSQQAFQTASHASNSQNTSANPIPSSTPAPQRTRSLTDTGTLITSTSVGFTTLANGAPSTYTTVITSSVAPSGTLNDNQTAKPGSSSGSAVVIGTSVASGVFAFIILVFGITWHIRRKRRNSLESGLDDIDTWRPNQETKAPQGSMDSNNRGPAYTYNAYGEPRPMAYVPVPTMSPLAQPIPLIQPDAHRLSAGAYSVPQSAVGTVAPLLKRPKTADEILYQVAREDLPRSRTNSVTASHHTRHSGTAATHRTQVSLTASHMTHGSMTSRHSESIVALLEHPQPPNVHSSLHHDAKDAQHYQGMIDAPPDLNRPMSPVSVVAPRLAIVNPDMDKES